MAIPKGVCGSRTSTATPVSIQCSAGADTAPAMAPIRGPWISPMAGMTNAYSHTTVGVSGNTYAAKEVVRTIAATAPRAPRLPRGSSRLPLSPTLDRVDDRHERQ